MALADINVETEGPAQTVMAVSVNGEDLTEYVFGLETGFEVGIGAYTTIKIRGAANISHDPDTIPFRDEVPEEPIIQSVEDGEEFPHE